MSVSVTTPAQLAIIKAMAGGAAIIWSNTLEHRCAGIKVMPGTMRALRRKGWIRDKAFVPNYDLDDKAFWDAACDCDNGYELTPTGLEAAGEEENSG